MFTKLWDWLKWAGQRAAANLVGFLAILWPTAWPRAKKALVALVGTSAMAWLMRNNIPMPIEDLDLIVNTALDVLAGPLTAFLVYRVPNTSGPSDSPAVKAMEMRT